MPTTPSRHPAAPRPVPGTIKAFSLVLGLRSPDRAQFARLGGRLMVGDPLADDLVDWMFAEQMSVTRPLFEQALLSGIDAVSNAPVPLRTFFEAVEKTPAWVDPDALDVAGQTMRSGGADSLYIARDVALIGGYMFAGFNQTLLRTGALEKGSNQRFAETSQWATDVISEGGLVRGGAGYASTLRVRMIHAIVRRHVSALPDWDSGKWGLPINQTDMAATLVGALIAPMVGGLGLGLINRPSEYQATAHLARYVGWLMGVDEEFLPLGFRDSIRVLYHTSAALSTPDETTKQLSQPMADDPLTWHYRRFRGPRRRIARYQHLGITAAFLGPSAMRDLGLPRHVVPWYPLVRIPVNLVNSARGLRSPAGRAAAAVRGQRAQAAFMRTMTPEATIGEAAEHLTGHAA